MARDLLETVSAPRDLLADMPAQQPAQKPKDRGVIDWLADTFGPNGNLRGSSIGGAMQGAADLGVGAVQLAANLVGVGKPVNELVAEKEKEYQDARAAAGRSGVDVARIGGNVAMTLPMGGVAAPASFWGKVGQGAVQGGAISALNPVTNGGDNYATDKLKDIAIGTGSGGIAAPVAGMLGRIINPKAANNPDIKKLADEGVRLTPGQALGGMFGNLEQKLTSVPVLGNAIDAARARGVQDLNKAALNRSMKPLGATATETGEAGIVAAKKVLSDAYDEVIPKLQLDTTNQGLLGRLSNLRGMAQSLPAQEAKMFDDVIAREIDGRIAPNGILSGQNLKDALASIRDRGTQFAKSPDAYQSDLGKAFKQLHKELLDEMKASNGANGLRLSDIDKAYANFKRSERAASSVATAGGDFTPAQLHNAVKALDKSKDKGGFARGDALMQDLSGAAKRVMGNSVPDSGTAGRLMLGGGGVGAMMMGANPVQLAAIPAAALAYTPGIQNALVAALTKRPDAAKEVANKLMQYLPVAGSSAIAESF